VAVIGKEWLTCVGPKGRRIDDPNDFVRSEIVAALTRGIPTIPVLVGGASMPAASSLPDALKPLAVHQALEVSDDRWSYDVGRLADALGKLAGKTGGKARRAWVAAAAALMIGTLALGVVFLRQHPTADPSSEPVQAALPERAAMSPIATLPPAAVAPPVSSPSETPSPAGASPAGVPPASGVTVPVEKPAPPARFAGSWRGEVTYSWGATYMERFTFDVDDGDVLGTASFLGSDRGIVRGTVSGDSVRFETRTQEVVGDWDNPRDVIHRYRGRISGDTIAITMQTEGSTSDVPVKFTVTRATKP
jgi:hypothetical protein